MYEGSNRPKPLKGAQNPQTVFLGTWITLTGSIWEMSDDDNNDDGLISRGMLDGEK